MPDPSRTTPSGRSRAPRAFLLSRPASLAAAAAVAALVVGASVPALAAPPTPPFASPSIEPLSIYQPQKTCDPVSKPGVVAFRQLVMSSYPGTNDDGIVRDCSVGGTSEHKEGRAWDWGVSALVPAQKAMGDDLIAWLLATDKYGNQYAMARRLGVMYIIWNQRIWGAYKASSGWQPYTGADPHTSHVHLSFNWPGAAKNTTFWGVSLDPELYRQWHTSSGPLTSIALGLPAGVTATAPDLEYAEDFGSVVSAERVSRP